MKINNLNKKKNKNISIKMRKVIRKIIKMGKSIDDYKIQFTD